LIGRNIKLVQNWNEIKIDVLYQSLKAKVFQYREISNKLILSKNKKIKFVGQIDFWNKWGEIILTRYIYL
jgi:hypothetical protein